MVWTKGHRICSYPPIDVKGRAAHRRLVNFSPYSEYACHVHTKIRLEKRPVMADYRVAFLPW